ncbi:unnamed protein product [Rotaria sordida]|uniref:Transposase n=1 Tax=Rotaria sordida TaxID=392033 RepID=A0A820DHB1_9BILA|nr:unnamed protein product [Rotaria sordida]CAF4231878.1 unnamed protein product [Rotaria sordida]
MEEDGFYRKQIQKRLNCNHNTIIKWGKIGFDNPRAFLEGVRTGRPEVSRNIEKLVLRKRTNKSFSLRKTGLQLGISHTTVKNILNDAELKWKVRPIATKLTVNHKKTRLKFCEEHKDQNLSWWDKILVTDSKVFLLSGGRNPKHHGRWVFDSEELDLWEVDKYSKGLHVYGGMTSKGLSQLVFISGIIDGERYVNEVLPILTDVQGRTEVTDDITRTSLFDDNEDWIFEQDHATCHDSNVAQEYLRQSVPDFFNKNEAPAKLDDLWCIERIWVVVANKVYGGGQKQPKSLPALKRRIIEAWKSLDSKILRKTVHQMPLRAKEIVKRKGGRFGSFKQHCKCQLCVE